MTLPHAGISSWICSSGNPQVSARLVLAAVLHLDPPWEGLGTCCFKAVSQAADDMPCRYEDVGQLQLLRRNHQGESSAGNGNGVSPGHINNLVLAPPAVTQAPNQVIELIPAHCRYLSALLSQCAAGSRLPCRLGGVGQGLCKANSSLKDMWRIGFLAGCDQMQ